MYGMASAPFLATRCVKQLALEGESSSPQVSKVIHRNFYVDDLLSGSNTIEENIQLSQQVSVVLRSGCFELRKWRFNSPEVLSSLESSSSSNEFHFGSSEPTKTLGLFWAYNDDKLAFQVKICSNRWATKRQILSKGLISPVVVIAEIMLQSLQTLKLSWDQEVPHLVSKWMSFRSELLDFNSLQIPRHVICH